MRIIDKDIDLYTTSVETYTDKLQRCRSADEPMYERLRRAAQSVLAALQVYRDTINHYEGSDEG